MTLLLVICYLATGLLVYAALFLKSSTQLSVFDVLAIIFIWPLCLALLALVYVLSIDEIEFK